MRELTAYERSLAERFRSSLFDNNDDAWDEGLIDPTHPEFPSVLAIAYPPNKRKRKTKKESQGVQERLEL